MDDVGASPPKRRGGRPVGRVADDHQARKFELARRALEALLAGGGQASMNDMARAAGVTLPTLKHYFRDRSGLVAAALRTVAVDAQPFVEPLGDPGARGLSDSLEEVAKMLAGSWVEAGVGVVFTAGLAAGAFDAEAGPGYLDGVLELTLRAVEARLVVHAERGDTRFGPTEAEQIRSATLGFVSPLVLGLMHQHALGGCTARPLDLDVFIRLQVEAFVRAHGARG